MTELQIGAFYSELTSRNSGFVPTALQHRIAAAQVLIAGCGSTGGAAVEPLARIGVQRFQLADNGDYELNNLNRQHASYADIGRNKAVVSAERILAVNADAEVSVFPRGIGKTDAEDMLVHTRVVIDGIDVTEQAGMAAKWALHESAARRKVPVISGYDMAGMQYVRCYDYRRPMRPLDGAFREADIEQQSSWQLLARLIPRRYVPLEMITDLRGSLNDPDYHVSQLIYTSLLFGAIATRMTVELIDDQRVRTHVAFDVHRAARRRLGNSWAMVQKPFEVARLLRGLSR
jgi:molybdopterin/thiamine biosynthesis adenylyltransferase